MSSPLRQGQGDRLTEVAVERGLQELELEQAEDYNPTGKQSFRIAVWAGAVVVNVG